MIEFKNVSFHYGGEHGTGEGVDNLNLTIQSGELVVLCGPSGGETEAWALANGFAFLAEEAEEKEEAEIQP